MASIAGNWRSVQYGNGASRARPVVWVRMWRSVMGGASVYDVGGVNHGRWWRTSSSRPSLPASRSCRSAVAVNVFVFEASRYSVAAVASTFPATSAQPNPRDHTTSRSWTTAIESPGHPR
jgi:hypothetical protein